MKISEAGTVEAQVLHDAGDAGQERDAGRFQPPAQQQVVGDGALDQSLLDGGGSQGGGAVEKQYTLGAVEKLRRILLIAPAQQSPQERLVIGTGEGVVEADDGGRVAQLTSDPLDDLVPVAGQSHVVLEDQPVPGRLFVAEAAVKIPQAVQPRRLVGQLLVFRLGGSQVPGIDWYVPGVRAAADDDGGFRQLLQQCRQEVLLGPIDAHHSNRQV